MNIVQVVTSLGTGGAEKLVAQISNILSEDNNVRIITILPIRGVPYEIVNKEKVEIIELNCKHLFNPLIALKIRKYIKSFDLIHTHTFYAQLYTSLVVSRKKLVTTEHNTSNNRRGKKLFRLIDFLMYKRYETIICISSATKIELNKWIKSTTNKSIVINNGIDIDKHINAKMLNKRKIGISTNEIMLTCVASLTTQKNHKNLITAMKKVDKNIKLFLVGDGILKEELTHLVKTLKLEEQIIFSGLRNDVENILKTSDMFILPSLWEGFGLVAVEAAACNLPIIVSNAPGLVNLFDSDEVWIIDQYDPECIAKQINYVASNLNIIKSQLVYKKLQEYSLEKMIESYEKVYYNQR